MSYLEAKYTWEKNRTDPYADIQEHLPTLRRYAEQCTHIIEAGVRGAVSSYAFALGLRGKPNHKLLQIDPAWEKSIDEFLEHSKNEGVNVVYKKESDLTCEMEETELLFIDTWHIYGQLKRELERWHPMVKKWIIMHDTTSFEWDGETGGFEVAVKQSRECGFPPEEIMLGLWPAIPEFLKRHPEWRLKERYFNNNGLTVLERIE